MEWDRLIGRSPAGVQRWKGDNGLQGVHMTKVIYGSNSTIGKYRYIRVLRGFYLSRDSLYRPRILGTKENVIYSLHYL